MRFRGGISTAIASPTVRCRICFDLDDTYWEQGTTAELGGHPLASLCQWCERTSAEKTALLTMISTVLYVIRTRYVLVVGVGT